MEVYMKTDNVGNDPFVQISENLKKGKDTSERDHSLKRMKFVMAMSHYICFLSLGRYL